MRKLFAFVCGIVMLLGIQIASAADLKVGVVDLKKILTDAPQVSAIRAKLKNQFDPQNKEIVAMQKNLQDDMDKYKKDSAVMSEQQKKDAQNKIISQQNKLRNAQVDFQKNVMEAEDKSMQTISQQIQDAVDKIAKDRAYDLVLAKGAVVYNNASFDITADVLKVLKK